MATVLAGAQVSPSGDQGPQGPQGVPGPSGPVGAGSGDVNGPASSVDNEVALYNATTGKLLKRSTGTGYLKVTSGVLQTPAALTKSDVGLGNVDNTSDASKPVSTAQQTALNLKQDTSAKGNVNGYASLDATGKVPVAQLPPAGLGDVVGPASATDGGVPLFSGTTGKLIKQSTATELATAINPIIWYQRMRSYNALQNPNFEIDQINAGALVPNNNAAYTCDRWWPNVAGSTTARISTQQIVGAVTLPGTSFNVSTNYMRLTLTTQQASLGASDFLGLGQTIEGSTARELYGNLHSVSLLVRSSVANLKFAMALIDSANTSSLTKLCTMGAANTWTLITLPNLPVWSLGTFPATPGVGGHTFYITLAAGTTVTGAPGTWIAGGKVGATGMDNFANAALNSTFDIAFVQHEPGAECTTLMDKPWLVNYEECLRYFCKTYNYGVAAGTVTPIGMRTLIARVASTFAEGNVPWAKPMVNAPTITAYNHATGTANSVQDSASVNHASVTGLDIGSTGMRAISFTTNTPAGVGAVYLHYIAHSNF